MHYSTLANAIQDICWNYNIFEFSNMTAFQASQERHTPESVRRRFTKPDKKSQEEVLRTQTRKYSRALCSDFVRIAWMDEQCGPMHCVGLLEDVSRGGMGIMIELPVPVDIAVYVQTSGFTLVAAVRHCELGCYGYLVGLEFQGGYSWNKEKWRPRHLLETPSGAQG